MLILGDMETNYLELATNAITIECVKNTHHNQHAPVHQVNTQVSHWTISAVNINGIALADWCEQFSIDANALRHMMTGQHKTKKAALQEAIADFARFIAGIDPEENWFGRDDETLELMSAAFDSIKAGK